MIPIYRFLIKAYQTPRLFMQLMTVKMRQIIKISIPIVFMLALMMTVGNLSTFNKIKDSLADAVTYIPQYSYQEGQLHLGDNQKPLYYQSDYFQLVIDDSVQSDGQLENLVLPADKQNAIAKDKLISVFLFKDQAMAQIGTQLYKLDTQSSNFLSRESLIGYLTVLNQSPWIGYLSQYLTYLLFTFLYYCFQMVVYALLLSSFNRRLSMKLTYSQRLKLTIGMTALPLLVIGLIQMMIPGFIGSFFIGGVSLFLIFQQTLKSHTLYVRDMLVKYSKHEISTIDLDNTQEGLEYMEMPIKPKQQKEMDELANNDDVLRKFLALTSDQPEEQGENSENSASSANSLASDPDQPEDRPLDPESTLERSEKGLSDNQNQSPSHQQATDESVTETSEPAQGKNNSHRVDKDSDSTQENQD